MLKASQVNNGRGASSKDAGSLDGGKEDQALETLRGFEEQLDWMLGFLEDSNSPAASLDCGMKEDTFGDYDTFGEALLDVSFPLGDALEAPPPRFFTSLMQDACPPIACPELDWQGVQIEAVRQEAAQEAASPAEPANSDASTATAAGEGGTSRRRKRGNAAASDGMPATKQRLDGSNPVGRPRVDPKLAYFRHIKRFNSLGGFQFASAGMNDSGKEG